MKTARSFMLAAFSAVIFLAGCTSTEIGNTKDVNPETIYQDYSLFYNEAEAKIAGLAVFRFAGEDGTTLVLSQPSFISVDGIALKVDSSDFAGAYYSFKHPAGSFNRSFQFKFVDLTGREYTNTINTAIPRLSNLPSHANKSESVSVFFEGLYTGEYSAEVSTLGTDSSFNISSTPSSVLSIEIPASELMRQKGKELTLNFSLWRKLPLQQATKEGGNFVIEYILKPVTIQLDEAIPVSMVKKIL